MWQKLLPASRLRMRAARRTLTTSSSDAARDPRGDLCRRKRCAGGCRGAATELIGYAVAISRSEKCLLTAKKRRRRVSALARPMASATPSQSPDLTARISTRRPSRSASIAEYLAASAMAALLRSRTHLNRNTFCSSSVGGNRRRPTDNGHHARYGQRFMSSVAFNEEYYVPAIVCSAGFHTYTEERPARAIWSRALRAGESGRPENCSSSILDQFTVDGCFWEHFQTFSKQQLLSGVRRVLCVEG
jgi:hypothetical protein